MLLPLKWKASTPPSKFGPIAKMINNCEINLLPFVPMISIPKLPAGTEKKYWELIADELSRAGWTWGYVSVIDDGRKIFVVDAHRDDGKRFIVRLDELLTAFLELERQIKDQVGVFPTVE